MFKRVNAFCQPQKVNITLKIADFSVPSGIYRLCTEFLQGNSTTQPNRYATSTNRYDFRIA